MRQLLLVPMCLSLLVGEAAAQTINVSVRDNADHPVVSVIQYRRAASAAPERLGRTESDGVLRTSFSCAPGTVIFADPEPGEYWNSPEEACQPVLPLRVRPRGRVILSSLLRHKSNAGVTRQQVALAIARAEIADSSSRWREDALLRAYLANPARLSRTQSGRVQTDILNQSSTLFTRVDRDGDGELSARELSEEISATPEN
jgi:hypothetical protein